MPARRLLNELSRRSLYAFTQLAFRTLHPTQKYYRNWHIETVAWHLEQVAKGDIRRLIIQLPPRHMKSLMASVIFPAWVHGRNPSKRIITASYSRDLSGKHALDYKRLVNNQNYRTLFPRMKVAGGRNSAL